MPSQKKRIAPKKLLSSTRPLPSKKSAPSLSSKATRAIIRSHHTLQKRLAQARASGDDVLAATLQSQINGQGGLQEYQRASVQGQAGERGGDSSRILMRWMKEAQVDVHSQAREGSPSASTEDEAGPVTGKRERLRLLEVGSLRPDNACARSGMFEIVRIDLNSRHPDIQEQDFMERPIPTADTLDREGFDVVSLSLVLNYVTDAATRGELLKRVRLFLRQGIEDLSSNRLIRLYCPGLFLVLPASCVLNSRYFDKGRLKSIMESLGYQLIKEKQSKKLVYYYWKHITTPMSNSPVFGKEERRRGKERNNFTITIA